MKRERVSGFVRWAGSLLRKKRVKSTALLIVGVVGALYATRSPGSGKTFAAIVSRSGERDTVELIILTAQLIALLILKLMVRKTHLCTHETQGIATGALIVAEEGTETIKGLNQRLLDLEQEIRLKGFDAQRLVEWLDKRDRELLEVRREFQMHLNVEEREVLLKERSDQIVKLGEQLRLLRR